MANLPRELTEEEVESLQREWRSRLGDDPFRLTESLPVDIPDVWAEEPSRIVYAKYYLPWARYAWYVTAFDREDTFYGLVDGEFCEKGAF